MAWSAVAGQDVARCCSQVTLVTAYAHGSFLSLSTCCKPALRLHTDHVHGLSMPCYHLAITLFTFLSTQGLGRKQDEAGRACEALALLVSTLEPLVGRVLGPQLCRRGRLLSAPLACPFPGP